MTGILDIAYTVIAPIFLIIGVGMLFARTVDPETRTLTNLLFYILFPALVLDGLSQTEFESGRLVQIGAFVLCLSLIMTVLGIAIARMLRLPRQTASAFVLTLLIANTANYGLPVNRFAFGVEGEKIALVYYIATAFVGNTLGVFLASRGTLSGRDALNNVFKVPLFYATLIGLFLNLTGTELPTPVNRSINLVAVGAIPIMLIMLGMQLVQIRLQKENFRLILLASAVKLVLPPLIALPLIVLFGIEGLFRDVALVQSAMPTAVLVGVLTSKYNSDAAFATAVILVSTAASILTLTVVLAVIA